MQKDYNYININKCNKVNVLVITSKADLFRDRVVYSVDEYAITFKRAIISDSVRVLKPSPMYNDKVSTGWLSFNIPVSMELDIDAIDEGKYYFDEDSDEDTAIIIYN